MTPDVIADRIAQDIRDGTYSQGSQLVQEDLARQYGVSRNPVREALRLLEARGLITIRGGGGATVRVLSESDLIELYTLRIALEPTIAGAIIEGSTPRAIGRLSKLVERMEAESGAHAWMNLNFDFHEALYALAERPRTASMLSMLLAAAQPYSRRNIEVLGGRAQADQDHRAMLNAIKEGDAERLARELVNHLTAAEERLGRSYDATA